MTTTNEHKTMASEQDRHNHDVVYKHVVVKGIQLMSLLAPPLVFTSALLRRRTRPFSLSRSLRTITLSTWLGGSALGVGLAYGRMSSLDDTQVADRAYRIEENKTQRRVDDYSTVGAVLGALITTTILLRRAPLAWVAGSGAAFGVAGGVLTHVAKSDTAQLKPEAMVEDAKEAVGKQGK